MRHLDRIPALLASEELDERPPRPPAIAPGRRTLTMNLAPRTAAPVQLRRADGAPPAPPGAEAALRDLFDAALRPDLAAAAAEGTRGPAESLPHLATIQPLFGRHDVTGIRAHQDDAARASAAAMGAAAYATGDHVAFAAAPDLHTAAHEAAHVVQQRAGVSLLGGVGAEGDAYERHADEVADRVVRGESAEALLDTMAGGAPRGAAAAGGVQRKVALQGALERNDDASLDDVRRFLTAFDQAYQTGFAAELDGSPALQSGIRRLLALPETRTFGFLQAGELIAAARALAGSGGPRRGEDEDPGERKEEPHQVFHVFLHFVDNKDYALEFDTRWVRTPDAFYQAIRDRLAEVVNRTLAEMPLECFGVDHRGRRIPLHGPWPERVVPGRDMTFQVTVDTRKANVGPDRKLIDLVSRLNPNLVVPCSHIDDTHRGESDSEEVASDQPLSRFVNVRHIVEQQKLPQVLQALERGEAFTLVLIDPSFAPGGDQVHMVQIVEYLEREGHTFQAGASSGPPHHVTIFTCENVRIVYIGAAPNSATTKELPNVVRIG